jgi:hypothetical protein
MGTNKKNYCSCKCTPSKIKKKLELRPERCEICCEKEARRHTITKKTVRLSQDHDHKTGKNRGFLCNNCNAALGYFKDSLLVMGAAIEYLRRY